MKQCATIIATLHSIHIYVTLQIQMLNNIQIFRKNQYHSELIVECFSNFDQFYVNFTAILFKKRSTISFE